MKKILVLAKQVPDTANVGADAMKEDGTVNRAALPAIFNPYDLHALELALTIKEHFAADAAEVHVLTMAPPTGTAILKEALYMGVDHVHLLSDKKFAGSDTWATAYILSEAIRQKIGAVDLIIAGMQAIDGDTGQVGPQVANSLNLNSVTYVCGITDIRPTHLTVVRDGEVQHETMKVPLPALLTVTKEVNTPRYPNARRMLKYFRADIAANFSPDAREEAATRGWLIPMLTAADVTIDETLCGLTGSPTRVHAIKSITLTGGAHRLFDNNKSGVKELVHELVKDYIEVES